MVQIIIFNIWESRVEASSKFYTVAGEHILYNFDDVVNLLLHYVYFSLFTLTNARFAIIPLDDAGSSFGL